MRVLFLSPWHPWPPRSGAEQRVANLVRQLGHRHQVHLLGFVEQGGAKAPAPETASAAFYPRRPFRPASPRAQLGFLSSRPRSVVDTFSRQTAERIAAAVRETRPDVVVAFETAMAIYGRVFRHLPAVFEAVELGIYADAVHRAGGQWPRLRASLTWQKHRRFLRRLLADFRACTVVSEAERQLLVLAAPAHPPIEVIPNCVDLSGVPEPSGRARPNTLIFTGSLSYSPNHDAMLWFLREVFPRIRSAVGNVELTITGDSAGKLLGDGPGIRQTGMVENLRPLLASAWASIAPIRAGSGTRVKIIEAMAVRTPVVATSKAAEGIEATAEVDILLGDDAAEFARQVVRLLGDESLRRRLGDAGRRLIEQRYDWAAAGRRYDALLERIT